MTRVLLAADGSPASLRAATTVGQRFGDAEVLAVTVVDGRSVVDVEAAEAVLERTAVAIDRPIQRIVRTGQPVPEICELAASAEVDVVALGAPHPRWLRRAPVGERLLRRLDCDVLVVPQQPA